MLVRHVQERQAVSCLNSFAPHHYCCITLAAHQVSQSAALRFSSHFLLLLTPSVCLLLINQVIVFCVLPPPSSDVLSPSPLICHPYQTLQGATKDKKKNYLFLPSPHHSTISHSPVQSQRYAPSHISQIPWDLASRVPRGRNATTACVQREASVCAHTQPCTHTPWLSRMPCNQALLWPWHTQRRKALMTALTQEAVLCTLVCTPKAFILFRPLQSARWPLYTLHTLVTHFNVWPS